MTPEVIAWLTPLVAVLAGWWLRNWTGPVASFLRRFVPAPKPDGSPAIDVDALIPDDPNSTLDDALRALLKSLLSANVKPTPLQPEKLSALQKLLELLMGRIAPVK
jgi:hypothetical protein